MARTPSPFRLALCGGIALAMLATVSAAQEAKAVCPLQVHAPALTATWSEQVEKAHAEVAARPGDCKSVLLEVHGDSGTLTVETNAGRKAIRELREASELASTLDALLVTLPAPDPMADPAPEVSPKPAPKLGREEPKAELTLQLAKPPAPDAATRKDQAERSEPAGAGFHGVISVLGGARFSGPGPLIGPDLLFSAGLSRPRWELALLAQWMPAAARATDDPQGPIHLSSLSGGLSAGRRAELRSVTLSTGAMLSVGAQHQGWHTAESATGPDFVEKNRAQALVGSYLAAALAPSSSTRLRISLSGELDALHIGESTSPAPGVPVPPWWSMTLSIGAESEVL